MSTSSLSFLKINVSCILYLFSIKANIFYVLSSIETVSFYTMELKESIIELLYSESNKISFYSILILDIAYSIPYSYDFDNFLSYLERFLYLFSIYSSSSIISFCPSTYFNCSWDYSTLVNCFKNDLISSRYF